MTSIEIDFDVFKALTQRRASEDVTYNEVLRQLLGLAQKKPGPGPSNGSWMVKGVVIPKGTEFRATHKGRTFAGVIEDGALVVNGKRFDTPSAAGVAITGSAVNGWTFWECRLPGGSGWQILKALRKRG